MEEINKDGGDGKVNPEGQETPKDLVLKITLNQQTGQLGVEGPGREQIFDEPMCFWMLHKARRFIEAVNAKAMQSKIITPQKHGIMDFAKRFKR